MEYFGFALKKFLSILLYPVGTTLVLWAAGLVLSFRKPGRLRLGLIVLGGLWLFATSLPLTGFLLLRSLEADAGDYADPGELERKGVKLIVVLGGDLRFGDLTAADRVANTSLVRVMEGLRLWKGMSGAKLVLSGGTLYADVMSTGQGMAELAQALGLPKESMILETRSLDTADEAELLKPLLGKAPFALVTSASHMRRSMAVFKRAGLQPLAAPADFEARKHIFSLNSLFPAALGLEKTQKAFHEYLGLLVLSMKAALSGS